MNETTLTWSFPNLLTVTLMVSLGFWGIMLASNAIKSVKGKPDATS